ncbi:uncharacterized protein LOC115060955 isoform X1 [Xyrichtys novacula]|uniref:Uncharacterized protein LOC115060955 isoform X1 n=1 Tax=Xyrichtys novacula TaxID=13765 RepID=A0AAV1GJY8_XYRNO|nr:uncharacterized protein LOC115060955 isoform X1 [Xyrichtys novacula]
MQRTRQQRIQSCHGQPTKAAAGYYEKFLLVGPDTETQMTKLSLSEISKEQNLASPEEKTMWKPRGAVLSEGTWRSPDRRWVLPPGLKDSIFSEAHGVGHAGISQMKVDLKEWWHPFLHDMLKEWVRDIKDGTKDGDLPITDWVLLRVIKRKWNQPRWTGPFRVTERTSHAVRLDGKGDNWFHLT